MGVWSVRKIPTIERMWELWEEYKAECDAKNAQVHEFSQRNANFVEGKVRKGVSYTLEGFCVYVGISRTAFTTNYADKEPWADSVHRMKEECEVKAREKFELGEIPPQLSGLWMSRYGYGTIQAETTASNIVDEWAEAVLNSDGNR